MAIPGTTPDPGLHHPGLHHPAMLHPSVPGRRSLGVRHAAPSDDLRRVPIGRGGFAHPAFWLAAACLTVAIVARVPLTRPSATVIATLLFVAGGMPHGAYDIALIARTAAIGRRPLALAVAGYVGVAAAMLVLWSMLPLVALILFLIVAAIHFGEDWTMLDEPLLKMAAGTAIIVAPAIGHPAEVGRLFAAMADGEGGVGVAHALLALAPVALLVTGVGIAVAWRDGAREWAAAMAVAIAMLVVAPPVFGFALFFVFLHSPRHLADARLRLPDLSPLRWLAIGAAMSAAAIAGWLVCAMSLPDAFTPDLTAQAFQLLGAVAVPHLIASRWIDRANERAAR
ncbi:Brp/Blh family beta-carotene 15,15'-dioxygenase [Sphingomonas faeni]|uniref:Brp/Blh family beta-carotene 15,15'-dioxygenase n=1 Tax=Sphingomonas faeni TaxID=185950 RepID=UPI0033585E9D